MPLPEPRTRWWSSFGATHCVEVILDRRFKTSVRLHVMNDLHPQQTLWGPGPGGRNQQIPESTKLSIANFERWYQAQPRIDLEWINTGSVWRRLPRYPQGYPSASSHNYGSHYCDPVTRQDIVVVDTISQGGHIRLAQIEADGTLERYDSSFDALSALSVFAFMNQYARLWLHPHPPTRPGEEEQTFPELLYRLQLLTRPAPPPPPSPEEQVQKAKKKARKKKRKRKPKEKPVHRPSIWERLMADDDA